jgi:hypothetical protein
MPDCLDIPLLSVNNWQINGYPGRKTIQIPSLLNINGKKVSFENQINYFYEQGQISPKTPTPAGWEVFDATAEDILSGIRELIELSKINFTGFLTPQQQAFNSLFPLDIPSSGMSRTSQEFLVRNSDRLQ